MKTPPRMIRNIDGNRSSAHASKFSSARKSIKPLIAVGASLLCLAASPLSASVILQADFNGTGGGTGGANNIVTSGGTGALYSTGGAQVTATIDTSNPFSTGTGGYLSLNDFGSNHAGAGVRITPTSAANSFDATRATGSTFNSYTGGFDFFFRTSTTAGFTGNSLRFFDLNGGNGGLRMTMLLGSPDKLRFELSSKDAGGTVIGSVMTTSSSVAFIADTVYHLAVTYATDVSGKVTVSLYLATGNTAINTASNTHLIGSATTSGVFDPLATTHAFNSAAGIDLGLVANLADDSKTLDIDTFRIYNAVPGTFDAMPNSIPEPATAGLLISTAAIVAVLSIRRRDTRK